MAASAFDADMMDSAVIEDAINLFFGYHYSIMEISDRLKLPEPLLYTVLDIRKPRVRRFSNHVSNGPLHYFTFQGKKERYGKRELLILETLKIAPNQKTDFFTLFKNVQFSIYRQTRKKFPWCFFRNLMDYMNTKGLVSFDDNEIALTQKGCVVIGSIGELPLKPIRFKNFPKYNTNGPLHNFHYSGKRELYGKRQLLFLRQLENELEHKISSEILFKNMLLAHLGPPANLKILFSVLEKKGVINNSAGFVHLTEKGERVLRFFIKEKESIY